MTSELLKERFKRKDKKLSGPARAFLYALVLSSIVFLPFLCVNYGYFIYYGDFNVQQIPFYQMCHDAIRNGNFGWSHTTDLGANFIGSYSFYLLGSPFFWLTLPFPSKVVPYLMAPLFILKFSFASMTCFIYGRRYLRSEETALIASLLYAFSGFSIYNVFFNHFHEAIIVFPLLLYGMDEYMYKRRRGIFAVTVFLSCFINYYFFVGQVTFCIIYWIVRMASKSWKISFRDFLLLFSEAVIGVLLSCLLLLPSCLAVLQNPRVNNSFDGWNAILYNVNQRYIHIIQCLFFPPDLPARPNFTPDSQSKWSSLGAYLPMFGMSGVIAFLQAKKGNWLRRILCILFFMAFVPILNASFQLFNASYYARWFYMLTLMMALATALSLESASVNWKSAITWTFGIVAGISFAIGLMPHIDDEIEDINGNPVTVYGLEDNLPRFWSYVVITLIGLAMLSFLFIFYHKKRKIFLKAVTFCVAFVSVIYSIFLISSGKSESSNPNNDLIPYSLNGGEDLSIKDELQYCRSDFYEATDNAAMFWQIPSIQAFHSIVPGSVMDFYPSIGVTRDVGSRPDTSHFGLRGLTSCKWLFDDATDSDYFGGEDYDEPLMPGWHYYKTENGFDIWQNDYYVPMGFYYDNYITWEQYDGLGENFRELLLLKGVLLDDTQIEKYKDIVTPLDDLSEFRYTESEYFDDCSTLINSCCENFSYDGDSFKASIALDEEKLVFFSVPYEDGWSASVNGETVDVEKVSVGFMAIKVPAGNNEILFTYKTPGLKEGALISVVGIILLAAYIILSKRLKIDRKFKVRPLYHAVSFEEYKEKNKCTFNSLKNNSNKEDP